MANTDQPGDLKYATTHEWVRVDGDEATIGISDYAQDNLHEVVFVDLPWDGVGTLEVKAGEKFGEMGSGNSDDLRGGSGGIGERAEKIENGANAEGAAGGHSVLHGGVNGGREEKSDADFFDGLADARGRLFDDDAELFEDVGCAGARTCGAIAVLGDAHACSGDDEGRGSGNVESIAAVAAGTAGIHEHFVGARMAGGENRRGVAAHGGGEADEFVDGFALHAESDEEGGDERVVGVAREDLLHDRVGFGAGEVFAREEFFEGGGNHELAARRRTSRFLLLS